MPTFGFQTASLPTVGQPRRALSAASASCSSARAEAMMRTMAERQVRILFDVSGVDRRGMWIGGGVVVGAPDREEERCARLQPLAVAFDRLGNAPAYAADGGPVP